MSFNLSSGTPQSRLRVLLGEFDLTADLVPKTDEFELTISGNDGPIAVSSHRSKERLLNDAAIWLRDTYSKELVDW